MAQRRAARAEARELRLKELEKQQQHNTDNNDDASDMSGSVYTLPTNTTCFHSTNIAFKELIVFSVIATDIPGGILHAKHDSMLR